MTDPTVFMAAPSGSAATDEANFATALGSVPDGGRIVFQPGRYLGSFSISNSTYNFHGLTLEGQGVGTVLENSTSGVDALSATGVPYLTLKNITAVGDGGTRDAFHLDDCAHAYMDRCFSRGSGRAMCWAQQCIGLVLNDCQLSLSVVPVGNNASVANPAVGLVLTRDGTHTDSGCNQFLINGGEYIVGQTPTSSTNSSQFVPGWAICVIRADGGSVLGPIAELSAGGIYLQFCDSIAIDGFYSELNPSDISYQTGSAALANGTATVTGSGTSWDNTATSPEVANGAPGKYLVAPFASGAALSSLSFAKVASLSSNTTLTLAAQNELLQGNWSGPTNSGASNYRLVGVTLFIDNCVDCLVRAVRGGAGAVLLRASARNTISRTVCGQVLMDANSAYNQVDVTTASGTVADIVDVGANNLARQIDKSSGSLISDRWMHVPGAGAPNLYGSLETSRRPSSAARPVMVVATITSGSTSGATQTIQALCDVNATPTTVVDQFSTTVSNELGSLVFIVPPGFSYKLHAASGAAANIQQVVEYAM